MISWTDIKKAKIMGVKKKRIERIKLSVAVVFAVIICLSVNYKRLELKEQQLVYASTLEEIKEDKIKEEERTEEILDYKAYIQTDKFAEEVAREKLGLVYPNEIIFKVEE